ncbi:MAG: VTT domain-containing protein [Thermoanaerobaculia bacterium]
MPELVPLIVRFGLPLVFFNVLLEQGGLPIPAFPTIIVAAALMARDGRSILPLLLTAAAACLIADTAWYGLGRVHGSRVLKTLCRISLSPDSCVKQTESLFARLGQRSLIFAKFVPGFSTVAPPMAGATGVGLTRFAVFDLLGSLLWAGTGIALGVTFRATVSEILSVLSALGGRAFLLLSVLLGLFVAGKWWQRRRFYRFLRMARISPDDLYALVRSSAAPAIFDVRTASARSLDPRRIRGAYALSLEELDERRPDLPRDQEIVLYCT